MNAAAGPPVQFLTPVTVLLYPGVDWKTVLTRLGNTDIDKDTTLVFYYKGHAVMELNKESESDRQFVLVQMAHETNEQKDEGLNMCKTLTAKRLRLAGLERELTGWDYEVKRLDVLMEAKKRGLIREVKPLIDALMNLGFRVGEDLYERVLQAVGEQKS